jgi:hypothetical protein
MEMSGYLQASAALTPKKSPGTHYKTGWLGPRVGLGEAVETKYACLCRESNPSIPARYLVTMMLVWSFQNLEIFLFFTG